MINSHYQNNEICNTDAEQVFKKVQFYWNLNKLEKAHASYTEEITYAEQIDGYLEIEN